MYRTPTEHTPLRALERSALRRSQRNRCSDRERQQQQRMRRKYVLGINDAGYIVDYSIDAGDNVYGCVRIPGTSAKDSRRLEGATRCGGTEGPRSDAGLNGGPSFA